MKLLDLIANHSSVREKTVEFTDFDEIKKECSIYLERVKNKDIQPLYRGIQKRYDVLKMPVNTKRKPRNSSEFKHQTLNEIIQFKTGHKNVRDRAAFALDDVEGATVYGMVYYFIPTNNSKVIYSPEVMDSIVVQPTIAHYIAQGYDEEQVFKQFEKESEYSFELNSKRGTPIDSIHRKRIIKNQFDETMNYIKNLTKADVSTFKTSSRPTEFMFIDCSHYYLLNSNKYDIMKF